MTLEEIFSAKLTENGDLAFSKISDDNLLNILFLTEYYQKHLQEVSIGNSPIEKLFAMFIRDPRHGLGRRDLGRELLSQSECSIEQIVKCGRVDDLFHSGFLITKNVLDWLKSEIINGNELVKKWMPRYASKRLLLAREIAKYYGMNKQQYGRFIKCNTTENKMSRQAYDSIEFDKVPSLAAIKYAAAWARKPETKKRYSQYLEDVRSGKKDLKVSTTTVYDIYENRITIDADLFFSKLEKISGNWIPIVDTSGSMMNSNDSFGKAIALGHYLAKCSNYAPNKVISFSSHPQLITLGIQPTDTRRFRHHNPFDGEPNSQYYNEIASMFTGDCSNTDFGAVMNLLSNLTDVPDYLIVLSDMEFDYGSNLSKKATMELFKSKGYKTRIVWWNLNSRNITCPEMDSDRNIFLSGYNPMLLKFLSVGFDSHKFLHKLLAEYAKAIEA